MADTETSISFQGFSSRHAPMTLSQKEAFFLRPRLSPTHLSHLGGVIPLPEYTSIDRIFSLIKYMLARHEALRSRYYRDRSGKFWQEILPSGEVPVRLRADDSHNPGEDPQDTTNTFLDTDYGRVVEFVVDMRAERPSSLSYVTSHLVADGWANILMRGQLEQLLRTAADLQLSKRGLSKLANTTYQPADQAMREATPRARALQKRSLNYWLETHGTTSETCSPIYTPTGARYRIGLLTSRDMRIALPQLSKGYGVSQSAILLASFARALAKQLNRTAVPIEVVFNSRIGPEQRAAIGQFSRHAPLMLSVEHVSLEALARVAHSASLKAYRYAHYDPLHVSSNTGQRLLHGSISPRFLYLFNFSPMPNDWRLARNEFGGLHEPMRPGTVQLLDWEATDFFGRFVLVVSSDHDSVVLKMICDTAFFPSSAIEESLLAIEKDVLRSSDRKDLRACS